MQKRRREGAKYDEIIYKYPNYIKTTADLKHE
jgi:hypothetical protein